MKNALILGIDALEYDLVEQMNLQNLKQKEYGKIELPLEKEDGYYFSEPITAIIWTSFITGKAPKDHGVYSFRLFPLKSLYRLFLKISCEFYGQQRGETHIKSRVKHKSPSRKILDKLGQLFSDMNLFREPRREDIQSTSLFDLSESVHLHIPVYDRNAFPSYKKKIIKAIEDNMYRPIFEMQCMKEFNQRSKEVFNFVKRKNEWKLFMQYFFVLDAIQHCFYNNRKKTAKFYIMFDEFVGKLTQKIDDNTILLIVSDHGQKSGIHTNYGFYSVNKPLGLNNLKLIDFRWILTELLE